MAYFRGLATGNLEKGNKSIGRLKLVEDSNKYPDLIDATFSGVI